MRLLLIILFAVPAHAFQKNIEMERFQALSRAHNLREYEAIKRRFNLLEAAELACEKEKAGEKVPVNCFVVTKVKGEKASPSLIKLCEGRARQATQFVRSEHLTLLPKSCTERIRERERLLAYKTGKVLE